jgi:hypothetical protein
MMGCGGCAVIAVLALFFGGWAMVRLGLDVFASDVESELRDNPVIIEHIGRIEELEVDLTASLSTDENDDFVFTVRGTKGSGLVHATCITRDDGTEAVTAGTIQLESGETLGLFPGSDESFSGSDQKLFKPEVSPPAAEKSDEESE